jgi:putative membrane protein
MTTTSAPTNKPAAFPAGIAIGAILAVSALASAFLFWLVYAHHAPDAYNMHLRFLPALNALFNGLSAIALITGFMLIKRKRVVAHRAAMLTAFAFSTLFLISYITNHWLHGDMLFPGPHNAIWIAYIVILISHITLSVVALPLVLITLFLALTRRFSTHRKVARWTYPIWLYVSVTGVIVGAMLAGWHG